MANGFSQCLKKEGYIRSVAASFFILILSLILNFYAGIYATEKASSPVTDLILNNIPVFNVDLLFVFGPILMWTFVAIICFRSPEKIPFILKSLALFIIIRSVFITLTHIGPFPDQATIDYGEKFIRKFTFGGDLFFSGHTGLPFLMALIFWDEIKLRIIFIFLSIFFGTVVLLAHLHYSIDVLSAFFITFAIYHMSLNLFKKERGFFQLSGDRRF